MVMTVLPYERMLVRAYASADVSVYFAKDYCGGTEDSVSH